MEKISIYVSKDYFLKQQKIDEMLKEFKQDEIVIPEDDIDIILQELDTESFFEEKKVIFIKDPIFLTEYTDNQLSKVEKYLKSPGNNYLVISVSELKDNKMVKLFKNFAKIIQIEERTNKNLKQYIINYFKDLNIQVDQDDISYIVDNANIQTIDMELEKLYLFSISQGVLLRNDIKELLTKNTDSKIYDLTSAILLRDKNNVMKIYNELLDNNEDVIRIVNNISYKFEELMYVKTLLNEGYQQDDIASYFKVSSGRAYHMVKDSSKVSYESLKKNINQLSDLDYKIKGGLINPKIGLEMYLLD